MIALPFHPKFPLWQNWEELLLRQIRTMTIENFKALSSEERLKEIRYNANLLGSFDRPAEEGGKKTPGDIYELYDFWVYVSEDESTVIPSRRNPIAEEEEQDEQIE
jgi:hypothetical protein